MVKLIKQCFFFTKLLLLILAGKTLFSHFPTLYKAFSNLPIHKTVVLVITIKFASKAVKRVDTFAKLYNDEL